MEPDGSLRRDSLTSYAGPVLTLDVGLNHSRPDPGPDP